MPGPGRTWLLVFVGGVVVASLPLWASRYVVWIVTEILVWGMFATSFNLVYGYTGMLSFGHSALFGLGMYAFAFSSQAIPVLPVDLGIGLLGGGLGALALGVVAVRVRGHGFAIVTLVGASILYTLAVKFKSVSGGDDGLVFAVPGLGYLARLGMQREAEVLYIVLPVTVAVYVLFDRLVHGRLGLAFRLLRDNEQRAEFLGYDATALKLMAFAISGLIAGLSGALYSVSTGYASVDFLHWILSADAIVLTFLGGVGTVLGPIVGSIVLIFVKDALSSLLRDIYPILMGCLVIAIVMYFPRGVVGTVMRRLNAGSTARP